MTGYKVTMEMNGRRTDSFSGYIKTMEEAKNYCEWLGKENQPKIITCNKKKITTWFNWYEIKKAWENLED